MTLRVIGVGVFLLCATAVTAAPVADDGVPLICSLTLYQETVNGEEIAVDVDLAESELTAAAAILALVEELLALDEEAVERILLLGVEHDRDVAELELKRQRLLLERKEAEIDQYENVCLPADPDESASDRRARLDDARRRYLQADCHRIGKELAIAEVNLAYDSEVLISVRDLRVNRVATEQQVIRAERDVEMAGKRVEHHRRRVQACVDSGAAGGVMPRLDP
jgi:hypothetical protein